MVVCYVARKRRVAQVLEPWFSVLAGRRHFQEAVCPVAGERARGQRGWVGTRTAAHQLCGSG